MLRFGTSGILIGSDSSRGFERAGHWLGDGSEIRADWPSASVMCEFPVEACSVVIAGWRPDRTRRERQLAGQRVGQQFGNGLNQEGRGRKEAMDHNDVQQRVELSLIHI